MLTIKTANAYYICSSKNFSKGEFPAAPFQELTGTGLRMYRRIGFYGSAVFRLNGYLN
jgi:hypothetical protein